ncbi:MAG: DnaA regulatory inactivator Hda [Azospira sp.]|jgi:DnaA family protein|nr:DnaA regulatory inactivator Hda [Azospira sp.]
MRQLLLDLIPDTPPTLENFVAGSNADALTALAAWLAADSRETCLFFWGESGAGKSHLLSALDADYADAATDPLLATVPSTTDFLAVDNVEALAADGQIALFNHFNRLRANGGRLLAAAAQPPVQLELREDLRTRLGSGLIYRLRPLSDDERAAALASQAAQRGMNLSPEALDYLLARAPRDMRSLAALLAALDRHSLEHKRPLTLPLLREVLRAPALQD